MERRGASALLAGGCGDIPDEVAGVRENPVLE